ncbi:MAG: MFS transporter [Micropepsaceae bacterium]
MTASAQQSLTPYLTAQATQFAAGGMMAVIFPWLMTHELHESQFNVGLGQTLANLPFMLLILVAGTVADGRDLRRFLPRVQLVMALFPIMLALTISTHNLTFTTATSAMFAFGVVGSFATPARDALLSHVTPHSLGLARASALAVAATFGGQVLGTIVAASASLVGPVILLAIQSALLATAAMLTSRVAISTPFTLKPAHAPSIAKLLHELIDGLGVVWAHTRLRTIIVYLFVGAPLFNGMFLVGIPLMVRDVFHGSSGVLSAMVTAFLLGLTLSSFGFSRFPPVEKPGRLLMLLSFNNVFVFTLAHFLPDPAVFTALMLAWGLTSGVAMSLTRGMIQIAAPHAYRARVMSVLQFSQMAGAPLGAMLFGAVAQEYGILNTILLIPLSVAIVWIVFRLRTDLWNFRREDHAPHLP